MKLQIYDVPDGSKQYWFWCPGCDMWHAYRVFAGKKAGKGWTFNGDVENPTFTPSLKVSLDVGKVCHLHLKAGRLIFLGDCYHELKGKTMDLPDIPEDVL